ncbi:MAG: DegT/DnrJ/EryC1/StrS family aminotransferase [Syntrophales bacterium]
MIPHSCPTLDREEAAAATRVLMSGQVVQGEEVRNFEEAVASLVGVGGAAAVSSGTAALHLALLALGVGEGDEVVLPSFVCTALLNAVRYLCATPVLADIDGETFNIDPRDVKRRLTKKTKAVIVPHLFGLPADVEEIVALGIPVVEDCAQALGSTRRGVPAGSFGALSVFSFYATKVICTGEGGMVAGNERTLIEKVKDLRDYDGKEDGSLRYNYKLTDLQAALGSVQLRKLPGFIGRRRAIARRYDESLRGYGLSLPVCPPENESISYRYVVRTERLRELLDAGQAAGIAYRRPVFKPLHRYLGVTGCPQSEEAFRTAASVPLYPSLGDGDVQDIVRHMQSVLR